MQADTQAHEVHIYKSKADSAFQLGSAETGAPEPSTPLRLSLSLEEPGQFGKKLKSKLDMVAQTQMPALERPREEGASQVGGQPWVCATTMSHMHEYVCMCGLAFV